MRHAWLRQLAVIGPVAVLLILLCACGGASSDPRTVQGNFAAAQLLPWSVHIVVDQFGYLPDTAKVAVIRSPAAGFDAADGFKPGLRYELRRAADGQVVQSGEPVAWRDGAVEASSGDRGWYFDFSSVTQPGDYFVADVQRKLRSPVFKIDAHVYKDVLKAAMRTYFYQRSGYPKLEPYAAACWTDEPAYLGKNQDGEAHDVTDRGNESKVRDLSGGWFDAGDTNKYVTYASPVVHQLLSAYTANPAAFSDDFGIPESGNGVPDVLDEVRWETDWLKKMQYRDGSAALKVGDLNTTRASPPSSDASPRFYVPSCTSATIAIAGMFAHASQVYAGVPALAADAAELRTRAVAAWRNFSHKPHELHCDDGAVRAGNADWSDEEQNSDAVVAAVYLYAVTGEDSYHEFVKAHYRQTRPYRDFGWARYNAEQGDALLFYTSLAGADAELKQKIRADKRSDVEAHPDVYGFKPDADLYRAFMHDEQFHWGSNQVHANYGSTNLDLTTYELDVGDVAPYRERALEILHYFHGVNPFAMVYLSNMYSLGATNSVNEIFHHWYGRYASRIASKLDRLRIKSGLADVSGWPDLKSKWNDARTSTCGPPPGYVPGGPNKDAQQNGVPGSLKPPAGQPVQKSYKDWNVDSPDASWVVTEPAIYYEAAYVRLLSAFAR